jgi:hypothetical protein
VDSGCWSAQAAWSASQPGAVRARERQVAGGLVGLGPFGQWAVTRFKRQAALSFSNFSPIIQIFSKAQTLKLETTLFKNSKNF